MQRASPCCLISRVELAVQATTSVSFYNIAPGLDVTLFGTLPDVASAAKVFCTPDMVSPLWHMPLNLESKRYSARLQM